MAGQQQARLGQPGHAAAPAIAAEYHAAEELLLDALLDQHLPGGAGEIGQLQPVAGLVPIQVCSRHGVFAAQDREQTRALQRQPFPVGMELRPDFPIQLGRAIQPLAPTGGNRRIQTGQVIQLHCHCSRLSTNQPSQLDHFRSSLIQTAEGQLAIQMQRQLDVICRP
ncbi:hypothetical protein D3C81_1453930 [compost metagenome]